jgi:hypothetical protein
MPEDLHSKTAISLNGMNRLVLVMEIQSVVGEKGAELLNTISIKYSVCSFRVKLLLSCLRNTSPFLEYGGSLSCSQQSARSLVFRCYVIGIPPNSQNCRPLLVGCPYLQMFYIRNLKTGHAVVSRSPKVRDWALYLQKTFQNTLPLLIHELTVLHNHWTLTPALAHVFSVHHTKSTPSSSSNKTCSFRLTRAFPQRLGPQSRVPNCNISVRNYKVHRHLRPVIK